MSTYFDLSTYIYSNLLNSKNLLQQYAAAFANAVAKFCCGSFDPISRAAYWREAYSLLNIDITQSEGNYCGID